MRAAESPAGSDDDRDAIRLLVGHSFPPSSAKVAMIVPKAPGQTLAVGRAACVRRPG
jgi:hypothetical protein